MFALNVHVDRFMVKFSMHIEVSCISLKSLVITVYTRRAHDNILKKLKFASVPNSLYLQFVEC